MNDSPQPVFLLSLPRSGSTLLQSLLQAHPDVATVAEPWFLLPLVHMRTETGSRTCYDHVVSFQAVDELAGKLEESGGDWRANIRRFAEGVYGPLSRGSRYFLDKTPRYIQIASELHAIFPEARFIILWRNPLAVLSSVLRSFRRNRWDLRYAHFDFREGLQRLVAFSEATAGDPRVVRVRYEDLAQDPQTVVNGLLRDLGMPELPTEAFAEIRPVEGKMGDPNRGRERTVSSGSLHLYRENLCNPLRKSFCRKYLNELGEARLARMGYDLKTLQNEVRAIPAKGRFLLKDLYQMPRDALRLRLLRWACRFPRNEA